MPSCLPAASSGVRFRVRSYLEMKSRAWLAGRPAVAAAVTAGCVVAVVRRLLPVATQPVDFALGEASDDLVGVGLLEAADVPRVLLVARCGLVRMGIRLPTTPPQCF